MSETYFFLSDQDADWNPVIKKFVTEMAEQGLLGKVTRGSEHGWRTAYRTTELCEQKLGITDPRSLFNYWYNKKRKEPVGDSRGKA